MIIILQKNPLKKKEVNNNIFIYKILEEKMKKGAVIIAFSITISLFLLTNVFAVSDVDSEIKKITY